MGYYRKGDPGFFDFLGQAAGAVGNFLGGAGKIVGPAVTSIGRIAAPIVGGIFGGPVGAAVGGAVGSFLGGGGDSMGAQTYSAPMNPQAYNPQPYQDLYTQTSPPFAAPGGYRGILGRAMSFASPPAALYGGYAPVRSSPPQFGVDYSQGPAADLEDYDYEEED